MHHHKIVAALPGFLRATLHFSLSFPVTYRPSPLFFMVNYDPDDWNSHLYDIRGSMIREIFARVATCVIWSAGVVVAHKFLQHHHGLSLAIPETAHALVGTALG